MNIKKRLLHLAELGMKDRQMGRTTAIVKAARETGGLVIAYNHDDAKRIEKYHGVKARSMEVNLHGFHGPFFFDHYAVETLLTKAANKIDSVEQERDSLVQEVEELKAARKRDAESIAKLAEHIGKLQSQMEDQ